MNSTTVPPTPRFISRKALLVVSVIADALDFLGFGAFPFFWTLVIDIPVTIIHFCYAGPRALVVLAEYIPFVGFVPIYTLAALFYDKQPRPATVVETSPPRPVTRPQNQPPPVIDI